MLRPTKDLETLRYATSAVPVFLFAALSPAMAETTYGYETVDGHQIFFREAGDPVKPTLVLLHGFPSSSHEYRNLIDDLSDAYHLIAPDYPGFGASDFPSAEAYTYSFDNIADTIDQFLEQRGLDRYSLFIQDYGAPIGMRIATEHPDRVEAQIAARAFSLEGLRWQAYLREHQPPTLIVWAEHDAFFPAPGAEGFLRDLEDVDYNILDTGHFALEEDGPFIAEKIGSFLSERGIE